MTEWITTKEAGEILGVSIRTIQRYVEKGKLKTKVISGKNSVKKDAIVKLKPESQTPGTTNQETNNGQKVQSNHSWQIPDGYLLIDKSTLESLREQIKKLTDSVGEMQLTQKLLIEKGLNLKENNSEELSLGESTPLSSIQPESSLIDTPIESVAKAHEDFFGKKKNNGLNLLWIIPSVIVGLIIVILIINSFAGISL